jgi:acetylornithine/succinyldiaminopimelate/putrescine aminotransferase
LALEQLQALERQALMPTYARNPVEFVRGEGTRLWDDEGNEYLDFLTGISVAQIGHCHPRVVEAVREQAGRLMHVGNLYYTEPGIRLAGRLSECSLGGKVFLCLADAVRKATSWCSRAPSTDARWVPSRRRPRRRSRRRSRRSYRASA